MAAFVVMPLTSGPESKEEKGTVQPRVSLSVREADLRDIMRAASQGTDISISFEPGIETVIKGVDLKGMTLEEILDNILPVYGLTYTKHGRNVTIRKGNEGEMRFYQVDILAMKRVSSKTIQVNASGQAMQSSGNNSSGAGAGASGGSGNSSAFTSTIQVNNDFDPWLELEFGLNNLIFGQAPDSAAMVQAGSGNVTGPRPRAFAKDGKNLLIQPDAGMVMVVASPKIHERVNTYLKAWKRRNSRQVIIEAKIVEVNLSDERSMGVDWNVVFSKVSSAPTVLIGGNISKITSDGTGHMILQSGNLKAALNLLAQDEKLKVLSSPRIAAMNNQKSVWRVVQEATYFIQNSQTIPASATSPAITTKTITPMIVPVGIILDILPQISDDGTIVLAVSPSVSQVIGEQTFPRGAADSDITATMPEVNRRDLDAVVRIRSGETLVLAGIIQTSESYKDTGVPWLRKLPWVGSLFTYRTKKKERTELAILITPTLMEEADQVSSERNKAEKNLEKLGMNTEADYQTGLPEEPKP